MMTDSESSERREAPAFGRQLPQGEGAFPPRELFSELLLDPQEHLEHLEIAHRLVQSLLGGPELVPPSLRAGDAQTVVNGLVDWALGTLQPISLSHSAPSWPARLARELAPVGLSDACWLQGITRSAALESDVGLVLLEQLTIRLGDPTRSEGYPYRYASLLQSIGVPPGSITRWEWAEAAPCVDISYEYGLLGLCLGHFPSSLLAEIVGFNLWMCTVGPAPLLERVAGELRDQRADLRYLDRYDRDALAPLARTAALGAIAGPGALERGRDGVLRGFVAAHRAYLRWERAMRGPNVPFTPRDSVVEMVRRKARFAADHHRGVRLGGRNLEALLREGGDAHALLVDQLAASPLVRPGDPAGSRLLSHTLSIDGPMFDAFTPREKVDLSAWIEGIGTRGDVLTKAPEVTLAGEYGQARDPIAFEAFAHERYAGLSERELLASVVDLERNPGVTAFVRSGTRALLDKLELAFSTDPRFSQVLAPDYSEHVVAELVVRAPMTGDDALAAQPPQPEPNIPVGLDGSWLRGFVDARRSDFDDYAWAFRAYRITVADAAPRGEVWRSQRAKAADQVLYRALLDTEGPLRGRLSATRLALASLALAANTPLFIPELLGLNLAVAGLFSTLGECTGESQGEPGVSRVRCAIWAVCAFIKRVRDAAPGSVERQWQRVWRAWRVVDLLAHGSHEQRAALVEILTAPSTPH